MREVIIFDTEFTAWDGSAQRNWTAPGEFREIIQIGALCVNVETLTEAAHFSILTRPVLNPILSDYICALTGIEQSAIDQNGVSLFEGVSKFLAFRQDLPMYCYGYDGWIIARNLALFGQGALWPGLRPINIGDWFSDQGFPVRSLNSGGLAQAAGVSFEGRAHDAVGDCRSILAAIRATVQRGAANPFLP
jgi:inhibitor of KinA sporulation pathway (predicted exonuclease)